MYREKDYLFIYFFVFWEKETVFCWPKASEESEYFENIMMSKYDQEFAVGVFVVCLRMLRVGESEHAVAAGRWWSFYFI